MREPAPPAALVEVPEAIPWAGPQGAGALTGFHDAEIILLASIAATYTAEELGKSPTAERLLQEILYAMQQRNLDAMAFTVCLTEQANNALHRAHHAETGRQKG